MNFRVVHDNIHGSFYLHKLLWTIIDTPIFQRLRHIKQTGNTCFVYPCANHTRFEHSLAVSKLCGTFMESLRTKLHYTDDKLDLITNKDILLMQIAGLCHDLGHCCFSHLFDGIVMPHFDPVAKFHHEQASCLLLMKLYKDLRSDFAEFDIDESDINTVCKIIFGSPQKTPESMKDAIIWTDDDFKRKFMLEILANEHNGIDIDKFDYLKRDCHYIGITTGFDAQRLMEFAYIDLDEPGYPLKYGSKANEIIKQMWDARSELHRRVYQHRVVKCYDAMISKALILAGDDIEFNGVKLKNIHKDMLAYINVTDEILTIIKFWSKSSSSNLEAAQEIIHKIENRQHWHSLFTVTSPVKFTELGVEIDPDLQYIDCLISGVYTTFFFTENSLSEQQQTSIKLTLNQLSNNIQCQKLEIRDLFD